MNEFIDVLMESIFIKKNEQELLSNEQKRMEKNSNERAIEANNSCTSSRKLLYFENIVSKIINLIKFCVCMRRLLSSFRDLDKILSAYVFYAILLSCIPTLTLSSAQ